MSPLNLVVVPGEPVVQGLIDQFEWLIAIGVLQPGDEVPGQGTLAKQLGISGVTSAKLYKELAERGVLQATPDIGTFVRDDADTKVELVRKLLSYVLIVARNLSVPRGAMRKAYVAEEDRLYAERPAAESTAEKPAKRTIKGR